MQGNGQRRFRSLKSKLRQLFIGASLVYIVCITIVFIFVYRNQMVQTATKNVQADLQMVGETIDSKIERVDAFTSILLTNEEVRQYYRASTSVTSKIQLSDLASEALTFIKRAGTSFPEIKAVFLLRNDETILDMKQGTLELDRAAFRENTELWELLEEKKGGTVILMNRKEGAFRPVQERYEPFLTVIRNYNDLLSQEKTGVLCINVETSLMESAVSDERNNRVYRCEDFQGTTIFSTGEDAEFETLAKKAGDADLYVTDGMFELDIYGRYEVPNTGMVVTCVEHYRLFDSLSYQIVMVPALSILLMILSLIVLDALIRRSVTQPIRKLTESMQSVKRGWLRRVSMETHNDEIGTLKDNYNEMLVEMNRLIEELLEKEKSVRKTEINILQQQIKPHFLYNTIEMIASLAVDDDVSRDQVYDALETLGSFYRQFLSKGSNEVPLSTEIEIAKKYLKLQKLRYGDIFTDEYEIGEDCLGVLLPKLTIQPIIENSLYHGIRGKGDHGLIRIRAFREEGTVTLEIYDDGVGMSAETIDRVMKEGERHFGLRRTLERFCYFEEREDCYKIESEEGHFTKITLVLREDREADDEETGV